MARAAFAHKPVLIHPSSTSRIERVSDELLDIRKQIAALTSTADELKARLLTMVKREGEPDKKGKIRYETDKHKYVIIGGKNVYIGETELRVAMTSLGIEPKKQEKILACKQETEYEYVGVYERKDDTEKPVRRAKKS